MRCFNNGSDARPWFKTLRPWMDRWLEQRSAHMREKKIQLEKEKEKREYRKRAYKELKPIIALEKDKELLSAMLHDLLHRSDESGEPFKEERLALWGKLRTLQTEHYEKLRAFRHSYPDIHWVDAAALINWSIVVRNKMDEKQKKCSEKAFQEFKAVVASGEDKRLQAALVHDMLQMNSETTNIYAWEIITLCMKLRSSKIEYAERLYALRHSYKYLLTMI